ncbi:MAG: hypothetical protein ACLUD0_06610 [Eubacterium ramulus]
MAFMMKIVLETVNASQERISDYKIYNNKYDQNNTNVYYWLGDLKDGTYVTNMHDVEKQEDAYEKAVNYGRYLSYNNKTFRFETNIGGIENNYYQNMAQYNELQKGDYTLIVAVDVNFPQEDDLAVAKREFDKLFPWAQQEPCTGSSWSYRLVSGTVLYDRGSCKTK